MPINLYYLDIYFLEIDEKEEFARNEKTRLEKYIKSL